MNNPAELHRTVYEKEKDYSHQLAGAHSNKILITNIPCKRRRRYTALAQRNVANVVVFYATNDFHDLQIKVSVTSDVAHEVITQCIYHGLNITIDGVLIRLRSMSRVDAYLLALSYAVRNELHHDDLRCYVTRSINAAVKVIPHKITVEEMRAKFLAANASGGVIGMLDAAYIRIKGRIRLIRSISAETTGDDIERLTITSFDELDKYTQAGYTIVVRAGMGTGKTQWGCDVISRYSRKAHQSYHDKIRYNDAASERDRRGVMYVAHRRSIVDAMAEKSCTMRSYTRIEPGNESHVSGLAICVNSIIKRRFAPIINHLGLVVVDESAQVLRHLQGGTVDRVDREHTYNTLVKCLKRAQTAILIDADNNDSVVELALQSLGKKKLVIAEMLQQSRGVSVAIGRYKEVYDDIVNDALSEKKVLVACDSKTQATGLYELIVKKSKEASGGPGLRMLLVHSDNVYDKAQRAFIADPSKTCQQYDVIIYSPAIQSSLSIQHDHFERHYGLYLGVVGPSDFIQMIARDRTAAHITIGIRGRSRSKREDESISASASNYAKIAARLSNQEGHALNRHEQSLWIFLLDSGYSVERKKDVRLKKIHGDEKPSCNAAMGSQLALETHIANVLSGDPDARRSRDCDGESTQVDANNKAARDHLGFLCVSALTREHVIDYEFGAIRKKISLLETLIASDDEIALADSLELTSSIIERDLLLLAECKKAFIAILGAIGIDSVGVTDLANQIKDIGTKKKTSLKVTGDMATVAMEVCIEHRLIINRMQIGIQICAGYQSKQTMRDVNRVLSAIGLRLVRVQVRGGDSYYKSDGKLERIIGYASNRHGLKKNAVASVINACKTKFEVVSTGNRVETFLSEINADEEKIGVGEIDTEGDLCSKL